MGLFDLFKRSKNEKNNKSVYVPNDNILKVKTSKMILDQEARKVRLKRNRRRKNQLEKKSRKINRKK